MDIKQALKLKPGDRVTYPPDRGDAGGSATVKGISDNTVNTSFQGQKYIWVSLNEQPSIWPSNRLHKGL